MNCINNVALVYTNHKRYGVLGLSPHDQYLWCSQYVNSHVTMITHEASTRMLCSTVGNIALAKLFNNKCSFERMNMFAL